MKLFVNHGESSEKTCENHASEVSHIMRYINLLTYLLN